MKKKSIGLGTAALALGFLGVIGNGCSFTTVPTPNDDSMSDSSTSATDADVDHAVPKSDATSCEDCCFDSTAFFAFDPTKVAAPTLGQNVCAADDISTMLPDCFHLTPDAGPPTDGPTQCDADVLAKPACAACLLGYTELPDGGREQGPTFAAALQIAQDGNVVPNTFGCIAALSTGTPTCKANFNALAQCAVSTCSYCADADFSACVDTELSDPTATCLQQFPDVDSACLDAVNTAAATPDATSKCASGEKDFTTALTTVATSLCGP